MIGLLNAYRIEKTTPEYQTQYAALMTAYLKNIFPNQEIKQYDVAFTPMPKNLDECDFWVITGSPKSAYDLDPWISDLGLFVRRCHQVKKKLIGICFGHQIIAQFLGGRTEQSKNGWGIGVRSFDIIVNKPWMKPELKKASLLFSHQDQVVALPPSAEILAKDDFCAIQMYSMEKHIFCLQGHPEFTPDFAKDRLNTRVKRIGQESVDKAIATLYNPTHSKEIGAWIKLFTEY